MKFILTDDGRLVPKTGGGFDYEYFIKDHLGNNRVTVADQNNDGVAEVMQEDHYYPFGMTMEGMSYQNPLQQALNKYLYNGKELQDDNGLNWYAYEFRMYDPQIARFHKIDPLADFFPSITPYSYAHNDPINFIDYGGLGPFTWFKKLIVRIVNNDRVATYSKVFDKIIWHKKSKPERRKTEPKPTPSEDSPIINPITIDAFAKEDNFSPEFDDFEDIIKQVIPIMPPIKTSIGEIEPGGKLTFTRKIRYQYLSPAIDPSNAENQRYLQQLLDILIQKEALQLEIFGNIEGDPNDGLTKDDKKLMGGRANAVKQFLEANGIDSRRLKARVGNAYLKKDIGRSTSFNLIYPK